MSCFLSSLQLWDTKILHSSSGLPSPWTFLDLNRESVQHSLRQSQSIWKEVVDSIIIWAGSTIGHLKNKATSLGKPPCPVSMQN